MINLTNYQLQYLPAIEWLISDEPRRVGKTFLLAYAFVQKAIRNRGKWIHPQEPNNLGEHAREMFMDCIVNICKEEKIQYEYNYGTKSFRIVGVGVIK